MESKQSKKFQIDLHIKMLRIKVTRSMPVHVVWSRGKNLFIPKLTIGQKTAKTKSRLLNESMDIAALDEKF
jgi:hypothetical protein